jgi:hypothetical protein
LAIRARLAKSGSARTLATSAAVEEATIVKAMRGGAGPSRKYRDQYYGGRTHHGGDGGVHSPHGGGPPSTTISRGEENISPAQPQHFQ